MASVTKENEGNRAGTPDDPAKGVGGPNGTDDVRALDSARRTGPRPAGFFTIYKKGQGYWVRMGTLLAVMVIGAMLAYTLYREIPNYGGSANVDAENVEVKRLTDLSNKAAEEMSRLKAQLTPGAAPAETAAATAAYAEQEARKTGFDNEVLKIRADISQKNAAYQKKLRAIAASVAGGFVLLYVGIGLWMMNKPKYVDFMIATDSEMKKVNWTSRRELIGSSKVVIAFMLLMALYLFLNDVVWGYLMYLIKVLQVPPPPFS